MKKKETKIAIAIFLVKKGFSSIRSRGLKPTYYKFLGWYKRIKQNKKIKFSLSIPKKTYKFQTEFEFSKKITFSIVVPLYNTPENFFKEMIDSVINQTYQNWELCLVDGSDAEHTYVESLCKEYFQNDTRIKYKKLEKNLGISENTNECIKMATGDYIGLFDHDDLLHPSTLFYYAEAICNNGADFVYCDEATFQGNLRKITFVHFKPDFAIDNLRANNYICHFTVFKKKLLEKSGLFRSEYNGSQDHDLILRLVEQTNNIVHIPKVLYFWRSHANSVALNIDSKPYAIEAGKKAVTEHLRRIHLQGTVESTVICQSCYKIAYELKDTPLITLVIPNKDQHKILKKCIDSIIKKSTYTNYEIIIIENNSTKDETFEYYKALTSNKKIKLVTWEHEFNYSKINNFAIPYCNGEHILLLNNDIEVITPNWIEEMLMYSQRNDVGAVGAMLYYPNNTVQHAGIILGINGVAAHSPSKLKKGEAGYANRLTIAINVTAVTAACLMVKKSIYKEAGGLDEDFSVAFNDVDFCMKIRQKGYLNCWTPHAELYHHESISRGHEDTPEKVKRFNNEVTLFQEKWENELEAGDPYYNPNLTLFREDFSFK